jgi:DNA-binding NarL/FixJ family response regulator
MRERVKLHGGSLQTGALPGGGFEVSAELPLPPAPAGLAGLKTRVLVLTTFDMDEHVYDALRAGASGFLLKDAGRERLTEGVRIVAAGESLFAPSVLRRLVDHYVARPPAGRTTGLQELSERELEVLRLIGRGLSNTEIAEALVISLATVKTHVRHVLAKLRLRDRVQAVVLAYESGLVSAGRASGNPPDTRTAP